MLLVIFQNNEYHIVINPIPGKSEIYQHAKGGIGLDDSQNQFFIS